MSLLLALTSRSQMLPIAGAAAHENPSMLEALIRAGANVNQPSDMFWEKGDFAITVASRKGLVDNVKVLLKAGADPNLVNSKGVSAIDAAAEGGHDELLMFLLDG